MHVCVCVCVCARMCACVCALDKYIDRYIISTLCMYAECTTLIQMLLPDTCIGFSLVVCTYVYLVC